MLWTGRGGGTAGASCAQSRERQIFLLFRCFITGVTGYRAILLEKREKKGEKEVWEGRRDRGGNRGPRRRTSPKKSSGILVRTGGGADADSLRA